LRDAALVGRAAAGKAGLVGRAAAARIHRRHKLEAGGIDHAVVGARDRDLAGLDRLAEAVENLGQHCTYVRDGAQSSENNLFFNRNIHSASVHVHSCLLQSPSKCGIKCGNKRMARLRDRTVKTAGPGRHGDGDGLQLVVSKAGRRTWVLRYQLNGVRRDMGLGSYPSVGLSDARIAAADARKLIARSIDPLSARGVAHPIAQG
jgi:hypothetical protein